MNEEDKRSSLSLFISYSRPDGCQPSEKLELALAEKGIQTRRDTRNIDPYRDLTAEIEKNIEASSHLLVCLTPDKRRPDSFVRR